ncbi:HNH endonuclease [Streptomyces albireticuli]|uniref:HNH endonuclease n=1 Tax=Streptomyces albireticuli TaxID=1940 RepID=UPI000B44A647|nr:HNH endonuclease signature motif containing protein [Streptomyces albireticuli]
MPRAKSICYVNDCTKVTVRSGRCDEHAPPARKGWDRRSARNRSRPGDWSSRRARVLARDRFTCQKCGTRENLQVDHIVSVSRGGSWDLDNLWVLCGKCHALKTYYEDRHD